MPRALLHDSRGADKAVAHGWRDRPGFSMSQSGHWDDGLLCSLHEGMLGPLDAYGVDFVRTWRKSTLFSDSVRFRAPCNPDTLVRFAASVLWRYAVTTREVRVDIGKYEAKLRRIVFENGSILNRPELYMYTLTDTPPDFDISRCTSGISSAIFGSHRAWGFAAGGVNFVLITDGKPLSQEDRFMVLRGKTKASIWKKPFTGSFEADDLEKIVENIKEARRRAGI